jgi:hypoxanthine-DNA glycosylase
MLLRHGVALWDVVARCEIAGASDASIRNPVPNDLTRILKVAPVRRIFATGATAAPLYRRLIEPVLGRPIVQLPSTSPANARWRLPQLVEAYRVIAEDL